MYSGQVKIKGIATQYMVSFKNTYSIKLIMVVFKMRITEYCSPIISLRVFYVQKKQIIIKKK